MCLVHSLSRDIDCEDRNCYIFLACHFPVLYSPAGEMNIFLISECHPLEDCMSPITKITPIPRVNYCGGPSQGVVARAECSDGAICPGEQLS